jgi:membrane-associated protease RseP (regulator of RpoE activity)
VVLLLLTVCTTTVAGAIHYEAFLSDFGRLPVTMSSSELLVMGFGYSLTIVGILGAHELGHYLTCRYYGVDATLPFFLPAPPPPYFLVGTLGAVIRIRAAFPNRPVLFDIAVAGPIAGFLVIVPMLFLGLKLSTLTALPESYSGLALGEPLLYRLGEWIVWGTIPDGYEINMHPILLAAWFGLFATALNLLPFGQLDGGHAIYAAFGRYATTVSRLTVISVIALVFVSLSWIIIALLMLVMLFTFGARHPPLIDEATHLDRARRLIGVFTVVMFIMCFTPNLLELIP